MKKIFILDVTDDLRHYWNDLLSEPCLFSKLVQNGGSVVIWVGFHAKEKTSLVINETKMNSFDYQDVLDNFVPLKNELIDQNLALLRDNASIGKSASTSDWLSANNIKTLDFPAKSPDINPTENLWGIMVRQVYANRKQFDSIVELKVAIL